MHNLDEPRIPEQQLLMFSTKSTAMTVQGARTLHATPQKKESTRTDSWELDVFFQISTASK
jgi:hypothetical protein